MARPGGSLPIASWISALLVTAAAADTARSQNVCLRCSSSLRATATAETVGTLTLEAAYTLDIISNISGGIDRGTDVLGDLSVTLSIDTEPLFGLVGGTLFIYGLVNHGGEPSDRIGDIQVVDNIEAPDTWKIYEAWYQQNLHALGASLLVGLYDLNSEFDVIESAALFINSSFGIGAEYGASGRNGPSIFPVTSLGARLSLHPFAALSGKVAVLDGVPGDPGDPYGLEVELGGGDGALVAGELTLWIDSYGIEVPRRSRLGRGRGRPPYRGKLAVGTWHYTSELPDPAALDDGGRTRAGTPGFYGLVEYRLATESPDRGPTVFFRAGWADPRVNRLVAYVGGGLLVRGPFRGRGADLIGLAVASAHNSARFERARREAGRPVDAAEVAIELTYAAEIFPWLTVQPDVQYIIDPGMEPDRDNATVLGLRVLVSY